MGKRGTCCSFTEYGEAEKRVKWSTNCVVGVCEGGTKRAAPVHRTQESALWQSKCEWKISSYKLFRKLTKDLVVNCMMWKTLFAVSQAFFCSWYHWRTKQFRIYIFILQGTVEHIFLFLMVQLLSNEKVFALHLAFQAVFLLLFKCICCQEIILMDRTFWFEFSKCLTVLAVSFLKPKMSPQKHKQTLWKPRGKGACHVTHNLPQKPPKDKLQQFIKAQ